MSGTERVFKVLVIGEPKVGKTAFVARYCTKEWLTNYKATIGADYAVKTIKWSDKETVRLHIWDIAGQDYARTMARTYYQRASGCVVMFDLTNRRTFNESRGWKLDVNNKVLLPNSDPVPCLLVANKSDLPNKAVEDHEIAKFTRDNGFIDSVQTSVKDDKNISEAMCQLVEKMLEQVDPNMDGANDTMFMSNLAAQPETEVSKDNVVRLAGKPTTKSNGGGNCCYGSKP